MFHVKKSSFCTVGHIFFVAPYANDQTDQLARWTMEWILNHKLPFNATVYSCSSIEMAQSSIALPLTQSQAPSLVVIDHCETSAAISQFSETLRNCIPEAWIIELVDNESWLPRDLQNAFLVRKPIRKDDWDDVLQHVFLRAGSPQWSRI